MLLYSGYQEVENEVKSFRQLHKIATESRAHYGRLHWAIDRSEHSVHGEEPTVGTGILFR